MVRDEQKTEQKSMEIDEAIEIIENLRLQFQSSPDKVDVTEGCAEVKDNQKVIEALGMAIKALEYQEEDEKTQAYREAWAEKGY